MGDLERLVDAAATAHDLPTFAAQVTLDPPASTGAPAGPPQARRRLPRAVDGALGEGPRVGPRARDRAGRRRVPVRHGHRQRRGRRRGAAAVLRRGHARPRRA
nr:hypothetical protein [Angustibacter aerolatus]